MVAPTVYPLPQDAFHPTPETLLAVREGVNPFGFHAMEFNDYAMVLSDPQLELLASNLGLADTSHEALTTYFRGQLPKRFASFMNDFMRAPMSKYPALTTHPCAWNMLLRRRCVVRSVCVFHSIYCIRPYPLSSLVLDVYPGSHSSIFSPLPTSARALDAYREEGSAFVSLVDSCRIVPTHDVNRTGAADSRQWVTFEDR